jgi:hypothetical protein
MKRTFFASVRNLTSVPGKQKKAMLVALLLNAGLLANAQWTSAPPNVYYNGGNVGIGTAAPAYNLHVNGDAEIGDSHDPIKYGLLQLTRPGAVNDNKYHLSILKNGFMNTGFGYADGTSTFGIWVGSNDGVRATPSLSLTPSGSVGIGTITPGSYKLAVEGKIGAREVEVLLTSPFPDYVFDSSYNLLTLPNLAKYINENKHLPGIPSAKEVETKGAVELGKLNTQLLEKIEEQTLYILELNKKIEDIYKTLETLKAENERLKNK